MAAPLNDNTGLQLFASGVAIIGGLALIGSGVGILPGLALLGGGVVGLAGTGDRLDKSGDLTAQYALDTANRTTDQLNAENAHLAQEAQDTVAWQAKMMEAQRTSDQLESKQTAQERQFNVQAADSFATYGRDSSTWRNFGNHLSQNAQGVGAMSAAAGQSGFRDTGTIRTNRDTVAAGADADAMAVARNIQAKLGGAIGALNETHQGIQDIQTQQDQLSADWANFNFEDFTRGGSLLSKQYGLGRQSMDLGWKTTLDRYTGQQATMDLTYGQQQKDLTGADSWWTFGGDFFNGGSKAASYSGYFG